MKCRKARRAIERLLDGELPPSEEEKIRQHLERCSDCANYLRQIRAVREVVAAALQQALKQCDRTALLRAIERRAAAAEVQSPRAVPRWQRIFRLPRVASVRNVRLALALGAMLVLLAIGIWWFSRGAVPNGRSGSASEDSPSLPIVEAVSDSCVTVLYMKTEDPHLHVVWFFRSGGEL